ncbi:MAG: glycosyltransferase family 2 protein [Planctomycetota bacterium]
MGTSKQKVIVVMPAYNAAMTVEKTVRDIPEGTVDEVILNDDNSTDNTVQVAKDLGITVLQHEENKGYGANQKSLYDCALGKGADIVVMVHPDYQYDPRVIPAAVNFLENDICDVIMGSRIRTRRETLECGMPIYKYISNRFLTTVENFVLGQNMGDFHSGFRVYTRKVLETIDYHKNSDDFVFDTEFLAQSVYHGFRLGDIPIPTRYFDEASSINFRRSFEYGLLTLGVMGKFCLQKAHLGKYKIFESSAAKTDGAG